MSCPRASTPAPLAPLAPLALLAALGLAAGAAQAQTSPYYIGASETLVRESNVQRLIDGQGTPAGSSRADTLSSTALLAGVDQPIGRQRVYGNLAVRANRYSENSIYDNDSYTAAAGLDWSTVERVSGTLSAGASRNLSSFNLQEIGSLNQKNMERIETVDLAVRVGLVTQYSLEAGLGHRQVANSLDLPAVQARNYKQETESLGVRWRPSAVSSYGVALRGTQGRFPKFRQTADGYEADRYKRRDIDFTTTYEVSGLSTLDARLSYGKTTYDLNEQRDFSGFTGSLGWLWRPTGKLTLDSRLARDTGQDSYATTVFGTAGTSDYSRTTNSLRVRADYAVTAKIGLNAAAGYFDREIVQTVSNPLIPSDAHGHQRSLLLSFGGRWAPTRSVLLGCDYSTERQRSSGGLTGDLDDHSISCYAQFTLQ